MNKKCQAPEKTQVMKTCGFQPLVLGLSVLLSATSVCKEKKKSKGFLMKVESG